MNSYIHKIFVHHNHVKKHFELDISREEKDKYRNLIITGKNGTGKSTLLRAINKELFLYKTGIIPPNVYYNLNSKFKKEELEKLDYINPKVELIFGQASDFLDEDLLVIYIPTFRNISLDNPNGERNLNLKVAFENQASHINEMKRSNFSIGERQRKITKLEIEIEKHLEQSKVHETELADFDEGKEDNTILKVLVQDLEYEREMIANKSAALAELKAALKKSFNIDSTLNPYISLSKFFLQYLMDVKRKQAYAIADEETGNAQLYNDFFRRLEKLFRYLYEDKSLKLKHSFKENKFFFLFKDGRRTEFSQLADGFKSILVIIAEILLQKEAFIQEKNLEIEPSGIVLIDEIEAHLHLSLQEKIFPAISNFFPKLQFILATHSPQVCASDKNSYVYDLSANHLEKNYLGGISYDVLAKAHFGLESEYSIETTALLNKTKKLLKKATKTENDLQTLIELERQLTEISPELAYELVLFLRKNALVNK